MKNFVYILRCKDGSLYTGWTNDLKNRVDMHNKGMGAKYTRGRNPCTLVYFEVFELKNDALKREAKIKKLTKNKKKKLVENFVNCSITIDVKQK